MNCRECEINAIYDSMYNIVNVLTVHIISVIISEEDFFSEESMKSLVKNTIAIIFMDIYLRPYFEECVNRLRPNND